MTIKDFLNEFYKQVDEKKFRNNLSEMFSALNQDYITGDQFKIIQSKIDVNILEKMEQEGLIIGDKEGIKLTDKGNEFLDKRLMV